MIRKLFLIFLLILGFLSVARSEDENCRWIYRCCDNVENVCMKLCDPEIICDTEESTQTAEDAGFFAVIDADCKHGYRHSGRGKCRKVL